jgi:hypothetical protein
MILVCRDGREREREREREKESGEISASLTSLLLDEATRYGQRFLLTRVLG